MKKLGKNINPAKETVEAYADCYCSFSGCNCNCDYNTTAGYNAHNGVYNYQMDQAGSQGVSIYIKNNF